MGVFTEIKIISAVSIFSFIWLEKCKFLPLHLSIIFSSPGSKIGSKDKRQRLLFLTSKGSALETRLTDIQCTRFANAYLQSGASDVAGFEQVLNALLDKISKKLTKPTFDGLAWWSDKSYEKEDKFLFDKMPNVTRSKIQDGIKLGRVCVNGNKIKPSYKVKPNDEVIVEIYKEKRDEKILPENIKLNIIYEDKDILIVNKKPGMVVHPAHENWEGTLVNALVYYLKDLPEMKGNEGRPGLVHRIDKDTSGLLVIAKNENAMNSLAEQFYNHSIKRKYQAIVWGNPKKEEGTIDVNLGRSLKDRRVAVSYTHLTLPTKA